MANVLLGVTASVAAIKTPELAAALRAEGHVVKVVATQASLYFFDPPSVASRDGQRDPEGIILDADEWPGSRYQRGDAVLHIELRRWADLFVIAPLDANTLAKLALGLSDNCLTCVWRAWDRERPRLVAPAMNTMMWTAPATLRHLRQLAEDEGLSLEARNLDALLEQLHHAASRLQVVAPIEKRLACEDVGVGALAELPMLLAAVRRMLTQFPPKVTG